MDHKFLIPFFSDYERDAVDIPRLQNLKGKRISKAIWHKGKDHAFPDALLRALGEDWRGGGTPARFQFTFELLHDPFTEEEEEEETTKENNILPTS